jgi:hypothetical protein
MCKNYELKLIDVISRKTYWKIMKLEHMDLEGLPNVAKVGLVGGITVMFVIGAIVIISWLF